MISLIVAHDGEGEVVGVSDGNPRGLLLVPFVEGHGGIGIPRRDPYECEDAQKGQDYPYKVFFNYYAKSRHSVRSLLRYVSYHEGVNRIMTGRLSFCNLYLGNIPL
jgi:hypothetical protein